MSLINDALKKVSEAERGKPAQQTDFATRSLQPVEYERRSSPVLWVLLPLLLVAVGVGGFLLAKQKQSPQPLPVTEATPAQLHVVEVAKVPAPLPIVQSAPPVAEVKSALAPAATPANISTTANATPAPTASAPTQPAPVIVPAAPTFRLKGILYTKHPTAIINDDSLEVGGEIDGAKVTKIDRTTVELSYQGKITVLKLGAR